MRATILVALAITTLFGCPENWESVTRDAGVDATIDVTADMPGLDVADIAVPDTADTFDSPSCTAPLVACGGACRDVTSDPANCGSCGRACATGQSCMRGSCMTCDGDGDHHLAIACGGDDCNDSDPSVHPGAAERCDGVDSDCNGVADTMDTAARATCFLGQCMSTGCDRAVAVAAGRFTCALLSTPRIACWGDGSNGEFTGSTTSTMSPIVIRPLAAAGQPIVSNLLGMCYRDATGIVRCAGGGPVGDGMTPVSIDPTADPLMGVGAMDEVALADSMGLARSGMTLYQWGFVMEPPSTTNVLRTAPTALTTLPRVPISIGTGWQAACAVLDDHSVRCWGQVTQGLGDPTAMPGEYVTPVGVDDAIEVSVGRYYFACARRMSGHISCWGDPPAADHSPVDVPTIDDALAVRAGYSHVCALRSSDHSVWCWGTNGHGELGDATGMPATGFAMTPVRVVGLPSIAVLGQAYGHTCAIDNEGFVWCWGLNDHGQIGDGTTRDALQPYRVVMP